MGFWRKHKNLILFLIVSILIIGGYFVYSAKFSNGDEDSLITTKTINNEYAEADSAGDIGSEILDLLLKMNYIKLNSEIFDNPIFKKLEDNSQEIKQEPIGREDPFRPI